MKYVILLLTILLVFACKNERTPNKNTIENKKETIVNDDVLSITIEVRTKEADKFELYYTDDLPESGFTADKRIAVYTPGGDDFQTLTFTLPNEVWPYKLRLDLGENNNKYETPVEIKSIIFKLNSNSFVIDSSIMGSFFDTNAYIEPISNGYNRKVLEGKYDPFLVAKPVLIKKMEIEL